MSLPVQTVEARVSRAFRFNLATISNVNVEQQQRQVTLLTSVAKQKRRKLQDAFGTHRDPEDVRRKRLRRFDPNHVETEEDQKRQEITTAAALRAQRQRRIEAELERVRVAEAKATEVQSEEKVNPERNDELKSDETNLVNGFAHGVLP